MKESPQRPERVVNTVLSNVNIFLSKEDMFHKFVSYYVKQNIPLCLHCYFYIAIKILFLKNEV